MALVSSIASFSSSFLLLACVLRLRRRREYMPAQSVCCVVCIVPLLHRRVLGASRRINLQIKTQIEGENYIWSRRGWHSVIFYTELFISSDDAIAEYCSADHSFVLYFCVFHLCDDCVMAVSYFFFLLSSYQY